MRRPLDWLVVSISLMVLFANRMVANSDPAPVAAVPALLAAAPEITPDANENPAVCHFAYVRVDGTQVFVPVAGLQSQGAQKFFEDAHALQWAAAAEDGSDTHAAVYTWSSPVLVPETPRAATSASPSWR